MNHRIGLVFKSTLFLIIMALGFSTGCQAPASEGLTVEEATTLGIRYMDTMIHADMDLIDEIISPDFVLRSPFFPEPFVGVDAYKAMVAGTVATFSDFNVTIDDVAVEGDRAFVRFTMSGVNTGPFGELPATGKSFSITGMAITRIVDGMIVEDATYWNTLDMYQQMGFTLTPPTID